MKSISLGKILAAAIAIILGGFILIQLVPYGRDHTNPPVTGEPSWNNPQTRALFMQSCGDCHSNETVWPWYTNIAPVSWLVYHDVVEGRSHVNVSEWGQGGERHADEAAEQVQHGNMPLPIYLPMHPAARLSGDQKQALVDGLVKTFGSEIGINGDHDN